MSVPPIHPATLARIMRNARGAAQERASDGRTSLRTKERQLIALRLASPKRAGAGQPIEQQQDAAHLPLFVHANEPTLI